MDRYIIVDDEGYRANTVLWDGLTPWDIPAGWSAVPDGDCLAPVRPVTEQLLPDEAAEG
jgi:hypothetical protein